MLCGVTDSISYSKVGDVALRNLLQLLPAIDPIPTCSTCYRVTSCGDLLETYPFGSPGFLQTESIFSKFTTTPADCLAQDKPQNRKQTGNEERKGKF